MEKNKLNELKDNCEHVWIIVTIGNNLGTHSDIMCEICHTFKRTRSCSAPSLLSEKKKRKIK